MLAVALGLYFAYRAWAPTSSDVAFRTAAIERGTITSAVSATGTVSAVVSVQVGSQISGQIKEIFADFNSPVTQGQLIARIDPQQLELRVLQAQADVDAARAALGTQQANINAARAEVARVEFALAEAARQAERKESLFARGFISEAERDTAVAQANGVRQQLNTARAQEKVAESQAKAAEAVLRQREAQLAQARVDLDRTEIRAPVDGIVIKRTVEAGQTVAASMSAPELFVIAQDLRNMQVDASIDESDVGRIAADQPATFTVDAFPGRAFRGRVKQVRKAALTVQNVVTYTVVVSAENPDLVLFPGMTANIRIVTDRRENVLKVPNAALRFVPPGFESAVPKQSRSRKKGGGPEALGQDPGAESGVQILAGDMAAQSRLAMELKLTDEQKTKLAKIFDQAKSGPAPSGGVQQADSKAPAAGRTADARARIAELLDGEQKNASSSFWPSSRSDPRPEAWSGWAARAERPSPSSFAWV